MMRTLIAFRRDDERRISFEAIRRSTSRYYMSVSFSTIQTPSHIRGGSVRFATRGGSLLGVFRGYVNFRPQLRKGLLHLLVQR